jgi:hypothetical protein
LSSVGPLVGEASRPVPTSATRNRLTLLNRRCGIQNSGLYAISNEVHRDGPRDRAPTVTVLLQCMTRQAQTGCCVVRRREATPAFACCTLKAG